MVVVVTVFEIRAAGAAVVTSHTEQQQKKKKRAEGAPHNDLLLPWCAERPTCRDPRPSAPSGTATPPREAFCTAVVFYGPLSPDLTAELGWTWGDGELVRVCLARWRG